jgi:hypothetical protein
MERHLKTTSKKFSAPHRITKAKNSSTVKEIRADEKKYMIQHFIHPDYILFDWEFFSRELEFE